MPAGQSWGRLSERQRGYTCTSPHGCIPPERVPGPHRLTPQSLSRMTATLPAGRLPQGRCMACTLWSRLLHTALPPVPSLHRVTSPMRPSPSGLPSTVSLLLSTQCLALAWGQQRHLLLWKPPVLELTVRHLGRWCGPPVYMALATQLPHLTCGTHLQMGSESPSPWASTGPQGPWTPRPGAAKTLILLTSCTCQARDSARHS